MAGFNKERLEKCIDEQSFRLLRDSYSLQCWLFGKEKSSSVEF